MQPNKLISVFSKRRRMDKMQASSLPCSRTEAFPSNIQSHRSSGICSKIVTQKIASKCVAVTEAKKKKHKTQNSFSSECVP